MKAAGSSENLVRVYLSTLSHIRQDPTLGTTIRILK